MLEKLKNGNTEVPEVEPKSEHPDLDEKKLIHKPNIPAPNEEITRMAFEHARSLKGIDKNCPNRYTVQYEEEMPHKAYLRGGV